jgi:oligopeptide/dipeptide ABC transporter ATP-binding protein
MITHDLGVVAETAQRVVVMYAGQVVEAGRVSDLFHDPRHPYTLGLQESTPRGSQKGKRLKAIPGRVPDLFHTPVGCRFQDRCPFAEKRCAAGEIEMRETAPGHVARCWKDITRVRASGEVES